MLFKSKSRPTFDRKTYATGGIAAPAFLSMQQSPTMRGSGGALRSPNGAYQSQNQLMLISGTQMATPSLSSSSSVPLLASITALQNKRAQEALQERQNRIKQKTALESTAVRISAPRKIVASSPPPRVQQQQQQSPPPPPPQVKKVLQLPEPEIEQPRAIYPATTVNKTPQTELKWDYRDCLREMTRAITEFEIVVEDDPPKKLERILETLFETRNKIRGAMLKSHREERLAELSEEMANCMQVLASEKVFRQKFAFYQVRFDEILANCELLKKKRLAEGASGEIFNRSQENLM